MDVPLEILDREVARAAGALAVVRAEPGASNPLAPHRRVSSRATWVELADATGPLAAPLRDWVAALTLQRVLWDDAVRLEEAWRAPSITVAETQIVPFTESPRDLLVRLLREADPARRRIFAGALERGARPAHDAARRLEDRRVEAGRLLGADVVALEIPVDPPASLTSLAARLLAETAPFLDRAGSWSGALSQSIAREAGDGWPARLNSRWLFDLFHGSPLTEGIRPALPPLPAAIGASSFARALGAFGAALAVAGAMPGPAGARSGPAPFFAMAWSPYDLRPRRRAALFAALTADPVFARRALGLGQGRAEDQARVVARALTLSLRLDAARVLLRGALSLPDGHREASFEEHTAAALGAPIPPVLGGLVPRLGPDDPARFTGALLAAADRRRLVDRFDEDWFRSPHAGRALREEDASPPASRAVPAASLEAGLGEIVRALGAL